MSRIADQNHVWEVYDRARQILKKIKPDYSMKQIDQRIYRSAFELYQEVLQEKPGEMRETAINLYRGIMDHIERIEGTNVLDSGSFILIKKREDQ